MEKPSIFHLRGRWCCATPAKRYPPSSPRSCHSRWVVIFCPRSCLWREVDNTVKRCLRPFGFEGLLLLKISQVGSCAPCPNLFEIITTKGALRTYDLWWPSIPSTYPIHIQSINPMPSTNKGQKDDRKMTKNDRKMTKRWQEDVRKISKRWQKDDRKMSER